MSLSTRQKILLARVVAGASAIVLRGRARWAAWAVHEMLRLGPSLIRNNSWNGPVARTFRARGREVWLTIDDGPSRTQTPIVLDTLAKYQAVASFFVIGQEVHKCRDICRRMLQEGHSIENHTYSHPVKSFWSLSRAAMILEMDRCSHAIRVATGAVPAWFRSPVGMTNSQVHPAADQMFLRVAGWSASGLDGLPGRHPEHVVARTMRQVRPGAIILLHDGEWRSGAPATVELLLGRLAAEGYRCVVPDPAQFS